MTTQKLIALDLDGTTLNRAGALTPQTIKTLRATSQAGHLVVLTTGRPDAISVPFYDQIGLDAPMINFNGALVHKPHQHWQYEHQDTIQVPTALALREFKQDFDINLMVAEGKQLMVADHGFQNVPFFPDMPNPTTFLNEQGLTHAPISVTMFIKETTLMPLQRAIEARYPQLTPKTWGSWSGEHAALEVTAGETSKSRSLAYVAEQYHIDRNNIIAFGDDLNDLDMLEFAGTGVAMQNAKPEILAVADDVTKLDNDQDGVAAYLADHLAM